MTASSESETENQSRTNVGSPGLPSLSREDKISLASIVAFVLLWEATVRVGLVPPSFFPAPTSIAGTFSSLLRDGTLVTHVKATLWRLLAAFLLASVPGIVLGLMMGIHPTIRAIMDPLVAIIYPIPKIAMLPLVMIIFGFGDVSIVVTASITAFFLVLLNTMTGVLEIDSILLDAAENFHADWFDKLFKVVLPGAMPMIFSGLRLGLGLALIIVVAAEFIASESGLGYLIFSSWRILRVETMYTAFIAIGIIGFLTTRGMEWLGDYLMPWRETNHYR